MYAKVDNSFLSSVSDSCVVFQILNVVSLVHVKTYATDMPGHIKLRVFFLMGLPLDLDGAQYALSVTRRPPLVSRCCHQQYCAHKTAEVVVCVFMLRDTHSSPQSECTISDTIHPFVVSYAWKHIVTCSLAAMSVFIGALLFCITLLHILWWIGLLRPPPRIRADNSKALHT